LGDGGEGWLVWHVTNICLQEPEVRTTNGFGVIRHLVELE